ncbi:neuropeptide CCHamide 1 isoform X2 [Calliopsis andreniformis]|uniref:neuropeptide CCHamide 1 isoform X2 n=1 Tax=Calliopsis andreniformis TaxID=337506 RepID=UPI003FCCB6B4
MANASNTSRSIYVRTWTIMIVSCFVGCAAAHGKRSGGYNKDIVASRLVHDIKYYVPSVTKEQWILYHLIGRPSVSTKYKEEWVRPFKIITHLLQHSHNSDFNIRTINDETIRHNSNEDYDTRRNIYDMQDIAKNIHDKYQKNPEIWLISNGNNNGYGSELQTMELFEFLSGSINNFE